MIVEESINLVIRTAINLIIGESEFAIKGKQGAPSPNTPYATVDYLTGVSAGIEQNEKADILGDTTLLYSYRGMREITFTLAFFKGLAIDNAEAVKIGLVRETIVSLFNVSGLGIGARSNVIELSKVMKTQFEERAQFDLTLSTVATDQEIIESIGSLDIAGEYQSRGIKYNYNIEVKE